MSDLTEPTWEASAGDSGSERATWPRVAFRTLEFWVITLALFTLFAIPVGLVIRASAPDVADDPAAASPFDLTLEQPRVIPLEIASVLAAIVASAWIGRRARLTWRAMGFARAGAARDAAVGLAFGCASFALVPLLAAPFGWVAITPAPITAASATSFLLAFGILLPASAFEELVFRGAALSILARRSVAVAIVATSFIFAAIHLPNPGADLIGFLDVLVAGAALAVARIHGGALWIPIGWHFGWNFAQGWIFGCTVSGVAGASHPLVATQFSGPRAITGGAFGPESGLLAVAADIIAIAAFLALYRTRPRWSAQS